MKTIYRVFMRAKDGVPNEFDCPTEWHPEFDYDTEEEAIENCKGLTFCDCEHKYEKVVLERFYVHVREIHTSLREIHATSAEEALQLVKDGDGDELECEYTDTMDPSTWMVEDDDLKYPIIGDF